jgi:hypothetical protein
VKPRIRVPEATRLDSVFFFVSLSRSPVSSALTVTAVLLGGSVLLPTSFTAASVGNSAAAKIAVLTLLLSRRFVVARVLVLESSNVDHTSAIVAENPVVYDFDVLVRLDEVVVLSSGTLTVSTDSVASTEALDRALVVEKHDSLTVLMDGVDGIEVLHWSSP